MTRLDANGEPSMEEILASIRKIIAEDPPGSRAAPSPMPRPAPVSAPASAPRSETPVPDRSSFFPSLTSPFSDMPGAAAAPQPAKSTSPFAQAPEGFATRNPSPAVSPAGPAAASPVAGASFTSKVDAKPERIEPSFASLGGMTPETGTSSSAVPAATQADDALSIDAQLSDLLGGEIEPSPFMTPSRAASSAPVSQPASNPAPAAKPAFPTTSFPPGGAMPGFKITRDGYVPSAPAAKTDEAAGAADPFAFDLGPSPFDRKATEGVSKADAAKPLDEMSVATKPVASTPAFDPFAMVAPKRSLDEASATVVGDAGRDAGVTPDSAVSSAISQADQTVPLPEVPAASAPVEDVQASTSAETETSDVTTEADHNAALSNEARLAFQKLAADTAMPSAEALNALAEPAVAAPTAESDAVKPGVAFKRDVMEFASALKAVDLGTPSTRAESQEVVVEDAVLETPSVEDAPESGDAFSALQSGLPVTQADAHQRSMEDTVAELLRPMLRTWLTENMPRIVERALLREIEAQLPSIDRKTAAE